MGADTEVEGPGLLRAAVDEGTFIGGAFTSSGQLVAYVHDFPTLDAEVRHSHRAAVDPAHRRKGLALALKRFQADEHQASGVKLVRWTYDPLRLPNAKLNIGAVGAIARVYLRNHYGDMTGVNAGTPSDRFLTEWFVADDRSYATPVAATTVLAADLTVNLDCTDDVLQVALPADFESLVVADPPAAMAWRMRSREVFEIYFDRGYAVTSIQDQAYILTQIDGLPDYPYPQTR